MKKYYYYLLHYYGHLIKRNRQFVVRSEYDWALDPTKTNRGLVVAANKDAAFQVGHNGFDWIRLNYYEKETTKPIWLEVDEEYTKQFDTVYVPKCDVEVKLSNGVEILYKNIKIECLSKSQIQIGDKFPLPNGQFETVKSIELFSIKN